MILDKFVTITLTIFVLAMVSVVVGSVFIDDSPPAAQTAVQTTEPIQQSTPATSQPAAKPKAPSTPTTNSSPAPTPAPAPAPTCGHGGACTMAEVSTHNSISDCWATYGSKVYNLTSYVNSHPGGADVFNSQTCGGDITNYLNGTLSSAGKTQNHSQNAYNLLANYYIGDLK